MKKTLLQSLALSALFLTQACAQSASRPVFQNSTTGALAAPLATGSQTLTISNGGAFNWTAGASLGGSLSSFRTAAGLAIGSDVQAYNANLAAIAAGTWTGAASLTTLGTITSGTWNGSTIAIANGGTGAATAGDARANLGLAIGSDVQAYSANLAAWANLAPNAKQDSLAFTAPILESAGTLSLDFASQAEAEAGASSTKAMNPLRTSQAIAALGASGKVLQVVYATETGTPSAGAAFATLMTNSITMINPLSKVVVFVSGSAGAGVSSLAPSTVWLKLQRGGNDVLVGAAASNRTRAQVVGFIWPTSTSTYRYSMTPFTLTAVETPGAGTHSYTLAGRMYGPGATQTMWLNRAEYDVDSVSTPRGATSFILVEIAP